MANRSTLCTLSQKKLPKSIPCRIKILPKSIVLITLKGVPPHDTLSHNFFINYNSLSHNFYQKRTPCRIIFTVKGHPVGRHIPSSQVWEYPPPGRICCLMKKNKDMQNKSEIISFTARPSSEQHEINFITKKLFVCLYL